MVLFLAWALCATFAWLVTLFLLVRTIRRLRAAYADPAYGVLNRAGGEAAWQRIQQRVDLIFLDLDHIHQSNQQLGYAEVDRRIRAAIQLRRSDLIVFRWYCGDEIVLIVPCGAGMAVAERLRQQLAIYQFSGTFGVVTTQTRDLCAEVSRAAALVQAAKAVQARGQIHAILPDPSPCCPSPSNR